MAVRARILVLTEDSGKQSHEVIQKILKEALKLVVADVDLNPARIVIEPPLPKNDRAFLGVRANQWKEWPPTKETILLFGAIAANLVAPTDFVVFHFDMDRVWAERKKSENHQKFKSIICNGVRRNLRGEGGSPLHPRTRPTLTEEQIEAALSRLLVLSPCYSIESWLYQATRELMMLCREKHDSAEHVQRIESWAVDRTLLDEVWRPKDEALPVCVGDRYNEELAKAFPAEEVWLAERSFYESVERLRACSSLVTALGP